MKTWTDEQKNWDMSSIIRAQGSDEIVDTFGASIVALENSFEISESQILTVAKVVACCDTAKENGEKQRDILRELRARSSHLCEWRKKFSKKRPTIKTILEKFGVVEVESFQPDQKYKIDTFEEGRININDAARRESIAKDLFMSGYTIWQTIEARQFFINFQKD